MLYCLVSQSFHQVGSKLVTVLYDKCFNSAFSSGQLDEPTHEMMLKPRCGLKDKHDSERVYSRGERFATLGELYRIFVMRLFVPLCVFITCSLIEDAFFTLLS